MFTTSPTNTGKPNKQGSSTRKRPAAGSVPAELGLQPLAAGTNQTTQKPATYSMNQAASTSNDPLTALQNILNKPPQSLDEYMAIYPKLRQAQFNYNQALKQANPEIQNMQHIFNAFQNDDDPNQNPNLKKLEMPFFQQQNTKQRLDLHIQMYNFYKPLIETMDKPESTKIFSVHLDTIFSEFSKLCESFNSNTFQNFINNIKESQSNRQNLEFKKYLDSVLNFHETESPLIKKFLESSDTINTKIYLNHVIAAVFKNTSKFSVSASTVDADNHQTNLIPTDSYSHSMPTNSILKNPYFKDIATNSININGKTLHYISKMIYIVPKTTAQNKTKNLFQDMGTLQAGVNLEFKAVSYNLNTPQKAQATTIQGTTLFGIGLKHQPIKPNPNFEYKLEAIHGNYVYQIAIY